MKWIGQNIYDLISRFRNDVYLEDISTGTIASGGNLGLDSNNKIVKATETTGDITGVDLTGTSPISIGSETGTTGGDYSATINVDTASTTGRGVVELATTAETTTGTDAGRVVTPDGLKDGYQGSTNVTTLGTIGTGVWQGTAIAHAYIGADAIDGDNIADDSVNSEHYVDGSIDTAHIADDQVTFAKASGVVPRVYGSIIKLLPTDFEANEDGGAGKTVQFDDTAPTGLKPGSTATELLAFASIPEGMKATHIDVYAAQDLTMECFELNINASGLATKGSGTTNTTLDITDVNSTATNYLMIIITTTATSDRIWGGQITIAAQ